MDFFIFLYVLAGVLLGTVTGLIPGLHPNTVSALILASALWDPFLTSILIISAAVAHSFLDFIPSVLLGAPDPSTALSILPGHKMMMRGHAYEAIKLTVVGGVVSLLLIVLFLPFIVVFIRNFYVFIKPNVHWILIGITGFMFLKDRNAWGIVVFCLSGSLGYLVLLNNLLGEFSLLPMLTGLFGLSMIIKSLKDRVKIPEQIKESEKISGVFRSGIVGTLSGMLVGLLPGVGAAQATFISREIFRDKEEKKFMIAIGGVNTTVAVLSVLALWLVGNPRSGVAVAVSELLGKISFTDVVVFIGAILLAGGVSAFLTLHLNKVFINLFRKVNYRIINFFIILFLVGVTFILTGLPGLYILFLSTIIGLVCILSNTRRSYMMACIIIPTVLFFL